MRITNYFIGIFLLLGCTNDPLSAQSCDRESVIIKNNVFEVNYSEVYEQPLWVIYTSTNRPTNVNRGSMDFHTESGICTSDKDDYYRNIWDKGHMAPAATYSDTYENLYTTFSYLNCSLQDQYLNRGEWRLLEAQERVWDDHEDLIIKVIPVYNNDDMPLPSGALIPIAYHKHIKFVKQGKIRCFYFLNSKPTTGWEDHEKTNCDQIEDFTF